MLLHGEIQILKLVSLMKLKLVVGKEKKTSVVACGCAVVEFLQVVLMLKFCNFYCSVG